MSKTLHVICPICGIDNTLGGRCDCQKIKVDLIPKHEIDLLARTVLKATARAFEDPAVRADFERWQAERQRNEPQ
ncbi:hypothetical protein [Ruminiclostridium josui]|uniref:hypothetical protein n=1 Tax=Ruminiclostridium josui TaxID=1499 RepID=UPI0012FF4CA6|nr:hypothetical protein [Ruminiclostridium josui]